MNPENSWIEQVDGLIRVGELDQAIAEITARVSQGGASVRSEFLLGLAFQRKGAYGLALEAYQRCLELEPGVASAWRNAAGILYQQGDFERVANLLSHYRQLESADRQALAWEVHSLTELGRIAEASELVQEFSKVFPYDPLVRDVRAMVCECQGRYLEAAFVLGGQTDALLAEMNGGHILIACMNNLGLDGLCEEYIGIVEAATENAGDDYSIVKHKADLASFRGDLDTAHRLYEQSIGLGNNEPDAPLHLALIQLSQGLFVEGWQSYRKRHGKWKSLLQPNIPEWQGEPLAGKVVLVNSEQGCGDVIQFIRYLPYLRETGATVIFNSYQDVMTLLKSDPRAEAGVGVGCEVLERIDYQTFLMEFPALLRPRGFADFPHDVPYLFAPPEKVHQWEARFAKELRFKVGVVWAGNPKHHNDHNRSASLEDFGALFDMPGVAWYSIQKGPAEREVAGVGGLYEVTDLSSEISDFSDTAAIVSALDLVICVDTSVAHLAGALGRPCWVLLPQLGEDWRWRTCDDLVWFYPTTRVFRQRVAGDWPDLIGGSIRPRLAAMILSDWRGQISRATSIELGWLAGRPVSQQSISDWSREPLESRSISLARRLFVEGTTDLLLALGNDDNARAVPEVASALAEFVTCDIDEANRAWEALDWNLPLAGFIAWAGNRVSAGQYDRARSILDRGLDLFPDSPSLHEVAGGVARVLGDGGAARRHFDRALEICGRHPGALLGVARLEVDHDKRVAIDHYQRATRIASSAPEAWRDIATLALHIGAERFSERLLRWLVIQEPQSLRLQAARVLVLALIGRFAEAEVILDGIDPEAANQWHEIETLAIACTRLRRDEDARYYLEKLVDRFPKARGAHLAFGTWLLLKGRCEEGWPEYVQGTPELITNIPRWNGESLVGKSLLVHQDQGYGDMLQFLPWLSDIPTGGHITLAVFPDITEWIRAQNLPIFRLIERVGDDWFAGDYDFQIGFMHLIGFLKPSFLAPRRRAPFYRRPLEETDLGIANRLDEDKGYKVGIVWAGNPKHMNDIHRSTCLEDWLCLAGIPGLTLYSLQKDVASNQALAFPKLGLRNAVEECGNLLQTAQVIARLDLVISVDSGLAHLAAGMGVETWILIPDLGTDFRWMLDRQDCPWYPSVRLFRQNPDEPWVSVLRRVGEVLENRISGE